MAKGLYIHIPFCKSICTYCDFPKLAKATDKIPEYLKALCLEIDFYQTEYSDTETIYIGGGTPSVLGVEGLSKLFEHLVRHIDLGKIKEFTLEANPSDITPELVALLQKYQVNRLSIGVQTSHDRLLKILGRNESVKTVQKALKILQDAHFENINLDFIYAIPTETMEELRQDIDFAVSLHPKHLSFYTLILEEKTKLAFDIAKGVLQKVDEDLEADMFETVLKSLPENGFRQYEISNFSLPGYESLHNMIYWNVQSYLGLGMGAHSQIQTRRFHNAPTLSKYIENVLQNGTGWQADNPCDLEKEFGIMGLRKTEGISLITFQKRFGEDLLPTFPQLLKNLSEGLIEVSGDALKLTHLGTMLMNLVEQSFMEKQVKR